MVATKSTKSKTWFCRVDGELEDLRPKVKSLAECIDVVSFLATHHTGKKKENPHTHFVIEMATEVQKQSFALRVKKHFQVVDRGYALDTWDNRRTEYGAVSYLFHEDDAPIMAHKLWTPDDLDTVKRIARDANVIIDKAKDKATNKFVDHAIEHFKDWTTEPTDYQIFEYLLEEVHAQRTHWGGDFRSKTMVQEIQIKLTNNLPRLTNEMYNRIFRN